MTITSDQLRWLIDINAFMTPIANSNFTTNTVHNSAIRNGYRSSTGAQNSYISFDVVLARGTWTLELLHIQGPDTGVYTVSLNGLSVGTIDGYNGSTVYNNRSSVTSITVVRSAKKRLTLTMATKNASSSSYYGRIQHIHLRRTA